MIEREGERLVAVTDIAFPRGTSVEVRDLFFNLPARRKFLRSAQSELGPVAKYVTQAALASPGVRFTLVHGARETISCSPVATLRERVFQIFGKKMVEGLMDVAAEDGEARIEGLSSLPLAGRADKSVQHFFVNGRPVKDRVLTAALNQAYMGILERGRSPEAFLFLRMPYADVDVNVHPAKAEVRFIDTQRVFRLVLRAVGEGAARGHTIKEVVPAGGAGGTASRIAEGGPGYQAPGLEFAPAGAGILTPGLVPRPIAGHDWIPAGPAGQGPMVLGQFANMYIVAAGEDGLIVIDQHNAHERVLYRQVQGDRPDEAVAAQGPPHPASPGAWRRRRRPASKRTPPFSTSSASGSRTWAGAPMPSRNTRRSSGPRKPGTSCAACSRKRSGGKGRGPARPDDRDHGLQSRPSRPESP